MWTYSQQSEAAHNFQYNLISLVMRRRLFAQVSSYVESVNIVLMKASMNNLIISVYDIDNAYLNADNPNQSLTL